MPETSAPAAPAAAGAAPAPGSEKPMTALQKVAHALDVGISDFFLGVGARVAARPGTVILCSLLLTAALGAGMIRLNVESNPEKLYTPQDSAAFDDRDFVEEAFGFDPRRNQVFAVARAAGSPGALTSSVLLELLDAHDALAATTARDGGRTWTRAEVCYQPLGDGRCDDQSLLDLWAYNRTTIAALSDADILAAVNGGTELFDVLGRPMRLDDLIGGVERADDGTVASARALQLVFVVKNEKRAISGEEDSDPEAFAWELEASTSVRALARTTEASTLEVFTQAAEEDEQDGAIAQDTQLLVFGYILLIVYGSLVLGRRNAVGSRSWLAYASVLAVGLAIVSGFGLCAALGVDFSLAVATVPFALLGLGMDDTFVIMGAHRQLAGRKDLSPNGRVAAALSRAGPSITLTSITDVVAFLCGTITVLPALRAFCFYAAAGVAFDFLYQVTFFVACVALDGRREASRRPDCFCCLAPRPEEAVTRKACSKDEVFDEGQPGAVNRAIGETLPMLTLRSGWTKAAVLVAAAAMVGAAAAGLAQLETDFNIEWFTPSGSYLHDVYDVRDTYFEGRNLPYAVYTREADYFEEQAGLADSVAAMRADRWTLTGSVRDWYGDYLEWLAAEHPGDPVDGDGRPTDRALFYSRLAEFLADSSDAGGASYASDVLLNGTVITAARFSALHVDTADSSEDIDAMRAARRSADAAGAGLDAIAFSEPYVFFEGIAVIGGELTRNVLVASSAVFVVCTLLLANLQASLIVMAMIGLVDVCLLGFLHHTGLTINSVTTINAVLAVGLAVDYSAHVAHSFMVAAGTRDERARRALHEIGGSVANGATSTFLAVVVMAGAQSYVFKVFFRCFALIVAFGFFFGIIVLPVVLSLIGPRSFAEQHGQSKADMAPDAETRAVAAAEAGSAVALVEVQGKGK